MLLFLDDLRGHAQHMYRALAKVTLYQQRKEASILLDTGKYLFSWLYSVDLNILEIEIILDNFTRNIYY